MANGCQGTACAARAHGKYHFMTENGPCMRTVNIIIVKESPIPGFGIEEMGRGRACERSVSGAENGAERAKTRVERSGAER